MKYKLVTIFICILFIAATMTTGVSAVILKSTNIPIFPGAQGFGTKTRGAYGGSTNPVIYKVTNLNADGSGSLRTGLEDTAGPRIIIFEVSGTIELNGYIWVNNPYVYVAGQTAPSPGITLKGGGFFIRTHDVIVQHIRIRTGDRSGVEFNWRDCLDVGDQGKDTYNVVIDHCSLSWATDENTATWFPTHDVTYQWCVISEGLYDSYHPDGSHSMGMLIGPESYKTSIHHNLFAKNADRNPLVGAYGETEIINNVIYNWEWGATKFEHYSGTSPQYGNIIGNYYKKGANTKFDKSISIDRATSPSLFYVHDNIGPTRTSNLKDDWDIVYSGGNGNTLRSNTPTFPQTGISTQNAFDAYNSVLLNAGARPGDRDSVDKRIVEEVKLGSSYIIDSQSEVNSWPILAKNYRALTIPSNPHDDSDGDGYRNIEEWLHSFAADVEKISSTNYTTEIESQPSDNNQVTETDDNQASNNNQVTETEDNQPSNNNQVTKPKNKHSSSKSTNIQETNSNFTTKSVGFLEFVETFYNNLASLSDLLRFQLQ